MSLKNTPKQIDNSTHFNKKLSRQRSHTRKISRKAQDAGSAAALVAIIGLLIVFYLLFIPPSFRDQILEGNTTESTSSGTVGPNATILKASPGTLSPISSEELEHSIPSVQLYSRTESEVIESKATIYTKTSIFGRKFAEMRFDIESLEDTSDVMLSFLSEERKGELIITVNGNEIYNAELDSANPEPLKIQERFLVTGENKIEFSAGSVGIAFWRVNKHEIRNVQVTASLSDDSQQTSRNVFVVSATEKTNVKRSVLRFSPDCITGTAGKLNVLINGYHSVYYSVPDCGGRVAIEFAPEVLREGENTIAFESDEGSYLIDLIRITSELKEIIQPAYYFEISETVMGDIRDGDYDLWLRMKFTDDQEQKVGTININGRETELYQYDKIYEKNINDYVIEGNNAVKIEPDTTLQIVELDIVKD